MIRSRFTRSKLLAIPLAVAGALGQQVFAQSSTSSPPAATAQPAARDAAPPAADSAKARATADLVNDAARIVRDMRADRELARQMERARGVFVVPDYGRAALGVGAQGGNGVLVVLNEGQWSAPMFYDMGGLSVGAQAGGAAGPVAFLLMTDKALDRFLDEQTFALDAGAGINVADWSARARATTGADAIAWSRTRGLFAGASVGARDIRWDAEDATAYYGAHMTPRSVLAGKFDPVPPTARELQSAMGMRTGMASATGERDTTRVERSTTVRERVERRDVARESDRADPGTTTTGRDWRERRTARLDRG